MGTATVNEDQTGLRPVAPSAKDDPAALKLQDIDFNRRVQSRPKPRWSAALRPIHVASRYYGLLIRSVATDNGVNLRLGVPGLSQYLLAMLAEA